MKRTKTALFGLAGLFLLYGSLVVAHAAIPHQCVRHGKQSVSCEHVKDSGDRREPGQPSENMRKRDKNKDWMDLVGCGCFWDCLFGGASA